MCIINYCIMFITLISLDVGISVGTDTGIKLLRLRS